MTSGCVYGCRSYKDGEGGRGEWGNGEEGRSRGIGLEKRRRNNPGSSGEELEGRERHPLSNCTSQFCDCGLQWFRGLFVVASILLYFSADCKQQDIRRWNVVDDFFLGDPCRA